MTDVQRYDGNGQLLDDPNQCLVVSCLPTPEICGLPPPPCKPCCVLPQRPCRPLPTRKAIRLLGGEVGKFFTFKATNTVVDWVAYARSVGLRVYRVNSTECYEFCFAPTGVTHEGRVYFVWSQSFMQAPAGYYIAEVLIEGTTSQEMVLYKPYSHVIVHTTWTESEQCATNGVSTPRTGCGCPPLTPCGHIPSVISEEFIETIDCGECKTC